MSGRGLVVVHVDGLSHRQLLTAIELGHMPFVRRLLEDEDYEAQPYRCGVPSTTPFAQAGILYGNTREIPSYRWWDKSAGVLVGFGSGGTFGRVAHRYFKGLAPLTEGGACVAALYDAGATDRFGPHYQERHTDRAGGDPSSRVIRRFLTDPRVVYYWLRHGGLAIFRITFEYLAARLRRQRAAEAYVVADLYHEVLVHHLTRYAVRDAMDEGMPVVYGCFYTFDEAAHAFGPTSPNALGILRHVDSSIRLIAEKRAVNRAGLEYEMVVLSDHGQAECEPFAARDGRHLGQILAEWLPTHQVEEHRGGVFGPAGQALDGHVAITYSGGLAHVYFKDEPGRLSRSDLEARFPGLAARVAGLDRVAFVMVREDKGPGSLLIGERVIRLSGAASNRDLHRALEPFDEPRVLAEQLAYLNSFERSGDLVLFGSYDGHRQVNFENQVGGHGSIGGDQLHPFLLAKRAWGFDGGQVRTAADLHPFLRKMAP